MSAFKSPPSSVRLRIARGDRAPLVVAAMLTAGAVVQLALPGGVSLPEDSTLAPRRPRMPVSTPVPAYPAILRAPIFAPDREPGEQPVLTSAAGSTSLQLIGVALSGRAASAIVRASDGETRVLHAGEDLKGWRLVAVAPNQAVFVGPGGRLVTPLGASPASGTGASNPPGTSETP